MSINFKKMTRVVSWLMTFGVAFAFSVPAAQAIEFFPTPLRYQWVSQSGTLSTDGAAHEVNVNAGDTVSMSLTIKNRSIDSRALVMYGVPPGGNLLPEEAPYRGAHELRVGVKGDEILSWIDSSSFYENLDGENNRFAVYDGPDASPGDTLTFTWNLKIKAGTADGTYNLYTGLVREFDAWARQVTAAGTLLPSEDIFWRVIVGEGTTTPAATGALTIALSGSTPAASSLAKSGTADFTRFTLTAAAGTTVKVSQLYVTRDGLTADSDVENIKIVGIDGVQVGGTAGGFDANHRAQIFFSPQLEITGSQDFYIRAGFASGVTTGLTARLGIVTDSDIVSNASSTAGAPVYGNYLTAVAVTIGTVDVTEDGSVANAAPDVGDTNVILNTFKITAGSTEPVTIERITVLKAGTAEAADTNNIELWDVTNNQTLGTVENWSSSDKASWPVNLSLGKGDNIRLRVQIDIVDGSSLSVAADIADGTDFLVDVKGQTYGFYITPTAALEGTNWTKDATATYGTNNLGQGDKFQVINAGTLTITKSASTPATGNIAVGDNQLITVWDFDVRGESMRISSTIVYGNLTDAGGSTTATYADLTNARLVDMATGNILSGPVDGADDASAVYGTAGVDAKFTFSNTYVLPVGVTKVGFKVRLGTDFENTDDLTVAIAAAGDVVTKGIMTNNTITPGGTYASAGNTQTVKAGALVVETLGIPATSNLVVNSQDVVIATYSFNAIASGEDVLVSAFTITDDVDATTGETDDFSNMELWADLDDNGSYETKISNTQQPDNNAAGTDDTVAFTLTTTVLVPKGESRKVQLKADVVSTATAVGSHILETSNGACATATGQTTGSDIAETAAGLSTNATITIAGNGSITTALAAASPDSAIMIAGGTTYSTLAAFDLTAADEPINLTKLTFDLTNGWDSLSSLKISYPTATGTATRTVSPSSAAVTFDGLSPALHIAKNAVATVTVSGLAKRIQSGSGGVFHDSVIVILDMDAAGELAGTFAQSGVAITGSTTGTTNRTANTFVLYNSMPTISPANPAGTGTIQPGSNIDLYKFTVTADAAGDIAIKSFRFTVFITDASTTNPTSADLSYFTFLRDGTDITSTSQITDNTTTTAALNIEGANTVENNTSSLIQVTFNNAPEDGGEQLITAGSTVTYTLRALAGTGFTTTDAISTSMSYDAAAQTANYYYLADVDATGGYEQEVGLATATSDGTMYNFIWSDKSTLAHVASFDDDGTTHTSSGDWTNGYLVKNFPLSGYGYTL